MTGLVSGLVRGIVYIPDPFAGWIPFALKAAERLIRQSRPDVIVASSGPPSALIVAHMLWLRHRIPWIADMRDLWVENHDYPYPSWRRPADRILEKRVLRSAAALVTVSEPLAERLRKFGPPVHVVLNGYDESEYTTAGPQPKQTGLRIVYTGTIYRQQSPAPLFEALRILGPLAENIRVVFFGAPASEIIPAANAAGVRHLVEVHGPVPRTVALMEQASADILLHLLWNDPTQPGVYGAKVFEYIRAGRPILAVGNTSNVAAQLVNQREAGVATDAVSCIAEQLKGWLATIARSESVPAIPADASRGLSRDEQTRVLERILRSSCATPATTDGSFVVR
jgi:glycosyltransferase involved in cell wall biosynthesis